MTDTPTAPDAAAASERAQTPGPRGVSFMAFAALASMLMLQLLGFSLRDAPTLVTAAIGHIVAIAGLGFWFARTFRLDVRLGERTGRQVIGASMTGFGMALLGAALVVVTTQVGVGLAPEVMGAWAEEREAMLFRMVQPDRAAMIPAVVLVVAALPALAEEFFYRGVLWDFGSRMSRNARLGVVSLLFAVAHLDPIAFVPLLMVGIVVGLLRERTDGWAIGALAHFVLNFVGAVVVPRLPESMMAGDRFVLAGLFLGAVLIAAGLRFVRRKPR